MRSAYIVAFFTILDALGAEAEVILILHFFGRDVAPYDTIVMVAGQASLLAGSLRKFAIRTTKQEHGFSEHSTTASWPR